jgi:hypothetical protein
MAYTTAQIVDALAQHLKANGLVKYDPSGAIPAGPLPMVRMQSLPATPDAAIAIAVYDENFDRDDHNPDCYIQLRYRTAGKDPRITENLADAVTALLHDASEYVMPGGVRVLLSRRKIRGLLEPDSNARYERADSFRFTLTPNG